jgi:hypothetical protein
VHTARRPSLRLRGGQSGRCAYKSRRKGWGMTNIGKTNMYHICYRVRLMPAAAGPWRWDVPRDGDPCLAQRSPRCCCCCCGLPCPVAAEVRTVATHITGFDLTNRLAERVFAWLGAGPHGRSGCQWLTTKADVALLCVVFQVPRLASARSGLGGARCHPPETGSSLKRALSEQGNTAGRGLPWQCRAATAHSVAFYACFCAARPHGRAVTRFGTCLLSTSTSPLAYVIGLLES